MYIHMEHTLLTYLAVHRQVTLQHHHPYSEEITCVKGGSKVTVTGTWVSHLDVRLSVDSRLAEVCRGWSLRHSTCKSASGWSLTFYESLVLLSKFLFTNSRVMSLILEMAS